MPSPARPHRFDLRSRYPLLRLPADLRGPFVDDQIATMLVAMRRLMWLASALFVLASLRDLVLPTTGPAVHALRVGFAVTLFALSLAFQLCARRAVLEVLAPLFLLVFCSAICIVVVLDPSRLAYSAVPLTMLPAMVGLLWTRLGHLLVTLAGCVAPIVLMLAWVDPGLPDLIAYALFIGVGVLLGLVLHWYRLAMAVHVFLLRDSLIRQARIDTLTGVLNRAGWDASGEAVLARAALEGRPLALAFLDLDHFKRVNDLHGHAVGDAVLEAVAAVLRRELRDSDLVARLGGEEFVLMLPGVDRAVAERIVERIREAVAQAATPVPTTLSAGVAERHDGEALEGLMHRADLALLAAKEAGRNQVRFAD